MCHWTAVRCVPPFKNVLLVKINLVYQCDMMPLKSKDTWSTLCWYHTTLFNRLFPRMSDIKIMWLGLRRHEEGRASVYAFVFSSQINEIANN